MNLGPLPYWTLLIVRSKNERQVAKALSAKGFEVFLPMRTVRRQWSDRTKIYETPIFPTKVFCKWSPIDKLTVIRTPGVLGFHSLNNQPIRIPDEEIEQIRILSTPQFELEASSVPALGEPVELIADKPVRGILIEKGAVCKVAICLNATGQTLTFRVPLESVRKSKDPLGNVFIPLDINSG
jgi:transcription antitermination factor NusG